MAGLIHPQYMVKVERCSWQCFNSQRWAKSKPKQHTATDNCILWPLWIFGISLLFGPQLAVAPGPPVRNPNRSKAAPGWHVCFKATKSACCFSAPAGSILCPFFFGLDWGARKIGYKCTCLTNKKYAQEKERSWGTWVNFTGGQSNSRNVHQLQQ